jgi:hypothetical protein
MRNRFRGSIVLSGRDQFELVEPGARQPYCPPQRQQGFLIYPEPLFCINIVTLRRSVHQLPAEFEQLPQKCPVFGEPAPEICDFELRDHDAT